MQLTATYSPEDNKLRMSASQRLPKDLYDRVRAAGFIWAPKQEIFVAPMWTPEREDLMIELCGEVGDEDTSLVERAEQRAERFEDYSDRRAEDATRAKNAVSAIADNIPFGQPILIGHHSERHARRDAEKIENGMRKAVKMWETSGYWADRAQGAIKAAKYKELPAVRARRIKTLEAGLRKQERYLKEEVERDRQSSIPRIERWIAHYKNRIAYESVMLGEQGGIATDRVKPEKGGGCKCWASHRGGYSYIVKVNKVSVTVFDNWGNGGKNFTRTIPFDKLTGILTAKQVDELRESGQLVEYEDKTGFARLDTPPPAPRPAAEPNPEKAEFAAIKDSLKQGVKVVSANQLFPTPPALAGRVIELAEIEPGHRILEPSAGTGRLLEPLFNTEGTGALFDPDNSRPVGLLQVVEVNHALSKNLKTQYVCAEVHCKDFLQCNGDLGTFDRIVMNPPFESGSDIKHIQHAIHFLKPGGRLIAICANGPRQREKLMPLATEWIDLPPGSFESSHTGVNTAICIINC